jgi:hypothetical protein
LVVIVLGTGCLDRELQPLSPCLVATVVDEVQSERIDKVDLLFVVDNSRSMAQEQAALEDQFPKLIRALTTGDRDGDGVREFEPATDLHLGVVSTDLGVPGATVTTCEEPLGDDGILLNTPNPDLTDCAGRGPFPRFLSYRAGDDTDALASNFGCIAQLGTDGCGIEQQLEAPLKALWPTTDIDMVTGDVHDPNRIPFLTTPEGFGGFGHGDQENVGFLRGPEEGLSVLAIVLVSDEEDCSMMSTGDIASLPPDQLNLRCFLNKDVLLPISRYVDGLRLLRPTHPDLVLFAAIVGVPEDLVGPELVSELETGDKGEREAKREAFYDRILDDPRMQETIDPSSDPMRQNRLTPSCHGDGSDPNDPNEIAYPPRRIVEVARAFGESGIVQSICQDDFGPAMDAVIRLIGGHLNSLCVPRKLIRNAQGLVGCDIVWELPAAGAAPAGTPTRCDERPYLETLPPEQGGATSSQPDVGERCRVRQLAVASEGAVTTTTDQGWYYDDFTPSRFDRCGMDRPQQLAFTDAARPPNGVNVKLQCLTEEQRVPANSDDAPVLSGQPSLGAACDRVERNGLTLEGDAACEVRLASPTAEWPDALDRTMFCHPQQHVCLQPCATALECPPAWVCDERPETIAATASDARPNGSAICVNPTCGTGEQP